jgi:hypothetical protein
MSNDEEIKAIREDLSDIKKHLGLDVQKKGERTEKFMPEKIWVWEDEDWRKENYRVVSDGFKWEGIEYIRSDVIEDMIQTAILDRVYTFTPEEVSEIRQDFNKAVAESEQPNEPGVMSR